MGALRTLALASLALLSLTVPGVARIHGQMYCWIDLEFPVPCDASDDEDEAAALPYAPPSSAGPAFDAARNERDRIPLPVAP